MAGIIIFENGDSIPFGNIVRLDLMLQTLVKLHQEMMAQEMERLRKTLEVYDANTRQTSTEDDRNSTDN